MRERRRRDPNCATCIGDSRLFLRQTLIEHLTSLSASVYLRATSEVRASFRMKEKKNICMSFFRLRSRRTMILTSAIRYAVSRTRYLFLAKDLDIRPTFARRIFVFIIFSVCKFARNSSSLMRTWIPSAVETRAGLSSPVEHRLALCDALERNRRVHAGPVGHVSRGVIESSYE